MINRALILTFFFIWIFNINAQLSEWQIQLNNAKHDTTRARLWNKIAWGIKFSNPLKSIEYAEKAIAVSYKYHLIKELSNGYKAKAHGYLNQKFFYEGLKLYDSAIYYAKASENLYLMASAYNKKAGAMGDFGDFDDAIILYTLGLDAALKTNDNKLKHILSNNLADAYQMAKRNTKLTQKYFMMAIDYALQNNDVAGAILSSANLAKEYSLQKLNNQAKIELKRTIELLRKIDERDYIFGATYNVVSSVLEDIGEFNLAKQYATISYHILDSLKMPDNQLRSLLVLSSVDCKLGDLIGAKHSANLMLQLATERNAKIFKMESYRLLSAIAKKENKYELALQYFEKYKSWNDSVFAFERERNINALEFKSNLAKKEIEAKLDLQTKEQLNKKLSSHIFGLRIGIVLSILAFIFIAIIGLMLYKANKKEQQFNAELLEKNRIVEQQTREKEILIQEIHHRVKNNLTMLQSLLYLQGKSTEQESVRLVLAESQTRILSMALVHQHLYENDREGTLDLVNFLDSLLSEISSTFSNKNCRGIDFKVSGFSNEIGIRIAVPLGLIINELITNSLKYAFNEISQGLINIKVSQELNVISIKYADNGPGLSKSFNDDNDGFGFKIIKLLSKQIRASIIYCNEEEIPSFLISIPV